MTTVPVPLERVESPAGGSLDPITNEHGTLVVERRFRVLSNNKWVHKATFICFCGNRFEAHYYRVKHGQWLSCGCWRKNRLPVNKSHGLSKSPEYRIWSGMIQRCTNANRNRYENYSGRGIQVCERWMSFEKFLADMGARPGSGYSLDRIDNDKGYAPDNCRWATDTTQARNRTSTRYVELGAKRVSLAEACELLGINYKTVFSRISRGMTDHEALGL